MNALDALAELANLACDATQPVPSPCISICRMDDRSGLCSGCFRSIGEIIDWARQTEACKRTVWQLIAARAGLAIR